MFCNTLEMQSIINSRTSWQHFVCVKIIFIWHLAKDPTGNLTAQILSCIDPGHCFGDVAEGHITTDLNQCNNISKQIWQVASYPIIGVHRFHVSLIIISSSNLLTF